MRCPFRMSAFDQPDECDPSCAWALRMYDGETYRCAVAVGARALNDQVEENAFMMVPYSEVGERR